MGEEIGKMKRIEVKAFALCAALCGSIGLFARERPGSGEYVSDGLVAHWDAVDNTMVNGVRSHNPNATTWCDLSGQGNDVTLPSFVTVGESSMLSHADLNKKPDTDATASVKYPTIQLPCDWAGDDTFTVEVVARRGDWVHTDDKHNLQTVFSTPRGAVGYRREYYYLSFPNPNPSAGNLAFGNWNPSVPPTDVHTISVDRNNDPAVGGARLDGGAVYKFLKDEGITLTRHNYCSMFGNLRADIHIHAIRVYNRALTDAERTQNRQLDKARFAPFVIRPMQAETYTGAAVEPSPVVIDSVTGERFVEGVDYTASYANNVRTGFANVQVTGIGDFAGCSASASFMIVQPQLYREIDYIESTGTQYIDTGYLPNPTTRMEADVMFVGNPANRTAAVPGASPWGCADAGGQNYFSCNFGGNSDQDNRFFPWLDKAYALGAGVYDFAITPAARQSRQTFTVDAARGVITHGTVTKQAAKKTSTHTQHALILFGMRGTDGVIKPFNYYKMRVYGWKIWDGSTLVRDFAPCYSVLHQKAGFFEKVSGHFYANPGTGNFAYSSALSAEALPADYRRLDCIVSTGAQHIATGVMAASDVTVTAEFMPTAASSAMRVFGARGKASEAMTAGDLFFEVYLWNGSRWACCCANGPNGELGTNGMWSESTVSAGVGTYRAFTLDSWGDAFCINDSRYVTLSSNRSGTGTEITLLKAHDSVQGYGRLRAAYIWKAGALVRNFVPCYRVADGLAGMYDLVNGAFHPAGGDKPFLHGFGGDIGVAGFGGMSASGFHAGRGYGDLTNFSFSAWVRRPSYGSIGWTNNSGFPERYGTVVAQGALGGTPGFCCYVIKDANGVSLKVQLRNWEGATQKLTINDPALFSDGEWHHIAFTFDYYEGRAVLYLDGKVRDSITSVEELVLPTYGGYFAIGARNDGAATLDFPYRGEVAHVTMWERELTADEVNRLRVHPVTGTEPGLWDAWTLSSGSAGAVGLVSGTPLTKVDGDWGFVAGAVKWHVPGMVIILR